MFTVLQYPFWVLRGPLRHRSSPTSYSIGITIPRFKEIFLLLMVLLGLGRGEAGKLNTAPSEVVVAEPRDPVPPDTRSDDLKTFLESYRSPLAPYAELFVSVADKYSLDWRLLPAIAGAESTFGKRVPYKSYNPFGWGNGKIRFASWEQGIEAVAKALYEKYALYGERDLDLHKLGDIYAESPRWPKNINFFMQKIEPDTTSLGLRLIVIRAKSAEAEL